MSVISKAEQSIIDSMMKLDSIEDRHFVEGISSALAELADDSVGRLATSRTVIGPTFVEIFAKLASLYAVRVYVALHRSDFESRAGIEKIGPEMRTLARATVLAALERVAFIMEKNEGVLIERAERSATKK